jgi:hypothetical protein
MNVLTVMNQGNPVVITHNEKISRTAAKGELKMKDGKEKVKYSKRGATPDQPGRFCSALLCDLKEWDDIDIIFLDAHAIGGRAWVTFGDYREWSESEVYVHVSGKFIELTEKYLKIVMGFGAHFGEGKTENVINPFAIPLNAIVELHRLIRVAV